MDPYGHDHPWPCMRGDTKNLGRARSRVTIRSDLPARHLKTGNAVFSTPVIGRGEILYVGSADHYFYAYDPIYDKVLWKHDLGEVVDSTACLGPDDSVYVPSGSGLYAFSSTGEKRWHLNVLRDRSRFTPSTIYWFEGSVVMGPNGHLYAGCDDFHFYCIDAKTGAVRWAYLTGCCVWTAAAFGPNNLVYALSFDCYLYAFDADSGRLCWSRNMRNFVASAPAIVGNTLFISSLDGRLYSLDARTGALQWFITTGGPLYASPTISEDGRIFVGSADGNMYCYDIATQEMLWSFYLGDCVRSSVALGVDPEGRESYLLYIGGGDGVISVFDRNGRRRWSYNTLIQAGRNEQYCNINAAIALGNHGFATASANGDVVYLPYDLYRRMPVPAGVRDSIDDGYPDNGAMLSVLTPGGIPRLLNARDTITVRAGDTISLRMVHREAGRTVPARIRKRRCKIGKRGMFRHESSISPDGNQLNIIPKEIVPSGSYRLDVRMPYRVGKVQHTATARVNLQVVGADVAPPISNVVGMRISHMSVYSPSIVASFDQIAIASLLIDVGIVHHDSRTGRVVGWGVQKFGLDSQGHATVGIPIPRFFLFAFSGIYHQGTLILESRNCLYEISAFPVPLDRLRFTARMTEEGLCAGSLLGEVHFDGWLSQLWKRLLRDVQLPCIDEWPGLMRRALSRVFSWIRSWFPEEWSWQSLLAVIQSARKVLPLGWKLAIDRVWHPWGLLDHDGCFCGVGTFCANTLPSSSHQGLRLQSVRYDRWRRQVIATFRADTSYTRQDAVPGILIYNARKMKVLNINYNDWVQVERSRTGIPVRAVLTLPPSIRLRGRHLRAIVLVDLEPRQEIAIRQLPRLRRDVLWQSLLLCRRFFGRITA